MTPARIADDKAGLTLGAARMLNQALNQLDHRRAAAPWPRARLTGDYSALWSCVVAALALAYAATHIVGE